MKIFKSVILTLFVITAFLSCQKELAFDNNGVSAGIFKKDGAGDCLPVTVNGVFKVDSVLTSAWFVDVQVNVSTPGTFDIKSDTINGISFNKAGSVVFGLNTIRLFASGKPKVAGTNIFTIKYGTSTCTFSITVLGAGVTPATFVLGGTPNACTGAVVGGTYTVGTALTPANTLTIQVTVATTGTYVVAAVSTSGFVFSGTGVFTITGLQNVTLTGIGTPLTAGNAIVSVTNIATTCVFNIIVQAAGSGTPAVFTLDGASGNCTNYVVNGTYTAGSAVSASNTVTVQVNVTTIGTYTITSNTANGISFSKTGVFTATGPQTIALLATGIPVNQGPFSFAPINGSGSSTCNFIVTFVAAPPIPTGDYFPLTQNSWWSYDVIFQTVPQADTAYNVVKGTKTYNSNLYTEIQQNTSINPDDTFHYRKNGSNYYQWTTQDFFSATIPFDNPQLTDILFLKENGATGDTWSSAEFTGTIQNITTAKLRYDFKIESANTSITVNGKNYTNVIYVSNTVNISIMGLPYTALEKNDYYYAKGIGLIKVLYKDVNTSSALGEAGIRNYKVF